ncbi:hypothetical protein LTR94_031544, partial [Friedmanniomyces endolithicus]
CRARDRGRSQCPAAPGEGPVGAFEDRQARDQTRDLAAHRRGDWRRLDLLLRRCADARSPALGARRALSGLVHDRAAHRHDLHTWRADARAVLHLRLPLAAYPGCDARREIADGHLQGLAGRASDSRHQTGGPRSAPARWRARRPGAVRLTLACGAGVCSRKQSACHRRLHRLQQLRSGVSHRHRHTQR